ncbi:hypothetical protein [Flavobacterium sp. UGB4466]|uniref:phage head completion protein n=1 Tax=Flavobacterium sp. UGB4466 TaxID=2730889 RepID=UPI00192C5938|nr:hypothetical protein [Flavobacterium sp. UGB4466]
MEKKPFIGEMKNRIKLVEKVIERTPSGAVTSSDVTVAESYARMNDLSGVEDVEGKVRHLVNRTYTIRYNPVVKQKGTALILIDEEKKYEIIHIVELGHKQHLELRVKLYE